jgi:hypothetical protein
LDAKLRDERADFDARFPGGQAAWSKVQDTEHDLRDLRDKLKKAAPKKPPAPIVAAVTTNGPPVASVTNTNEVKK